MMKARILITCVMGLVGASSAFAQNLAINWYTIDGGGEMFVTGGTFELSGVIGQPESGAVLAGGTYTITGGFWPGAGASAAEPCFGDLDGDLDIDLSDLATLLAHYPTASGANPEDGDLDNDGDVDLSDLAAMLSVYGTTCG